MKGRWPALVVVIVGVVVLATQAVTGIAFSADSGGYGSPAPAAPSAGGYGSPAPAPAASGGYGSPAPAPASSGGYGSPAPAPASSGGYGSPAPASSGGYGSPAPAPAPKATAPSTGGYGSPAPAPAASGGYGSPAPATQAKPAAEKKAVPAPAPAATTTAPAAPGAKPAAQTTPQAQPAAPAAAPAAGYGGGQAPAPQPTPAAAPAPQPTPAPPRGLPPVTIGFLVSALACGLILGWVLQRGRFCMNTAFRDTIFIKEFVTFRAYILALIVSIIGSNLLNDLQVLQLQPQPFWPVAHIVGSLVFGMGMVLAGGCGSGIWYRVGEGQLASWVAVVGFFSGISMTQDGILSPFYNWARSIMVPLPGNGTIYQLFGTSPAIKWGVIAVLAVAALIFIWPEKPFEIKSGKGYYWSVTGVLIGLTAILSFWASNHFGGFARGISFTTPTRELFLTLFTKESRSPIFPMYALGHLKITWGIIMLVGVPLGAFLSARNLKEFAWKTPRDPKELLTVMGGSLMMGFGGSLALGCNMGQGITGLSTLSIGSLVATLGFIFGNWIIVYFKFIKPMQDMDA